METKTCNECKETKIVKDFYSRGSGVYQYKCKDCFKKRYRSPKKEIVCSNDLSGDEITNFNELHGYFFTIRQIN